MSNIEADISTALFAAVAAAVTASSNPSLPIAYPMRTFTIPGDNRYLEVRKITNNIDNEFWGNERTYQGVIRLLLHWSQDNSGMIVAERFAAELLSKFLKGSILRSGAASVLIYENPDMGSMVDDSPQDPFIPLTIMYRDFAFA